MTGLDKIIQTIADDAQREADRIIADARIEAKKINDDAYSKAEINCARIVTDAREKAALFSKISVSGAQVEGRKRMLSAQREVVDYVIAQALAKLRSLPDDKYFDIVTSLCVRYAHGSGQLVLSEKDKARLPSDFSAKLEKALSSTGASLAIADDCARIDGGFILRYGGIEENCSFEAIAEDKKDEISDKLNSMLFGNTAAR